VGFYFGQLRYIKSSLGGMEKICSLVHTEEHVERNSTPTGSEI